MIYYAFGSIMGTLFSPVFWAIHVYKNGTEAYASGDPRAQLRKKIVKTIIQNKKVTHILNLSLLTVVQNWQLPLLYCWM